MATTIKLKNSVTTTNTPSSLAQGEVAINITDKKVWVGNAATTPIQLLGAGGSASFGALTCTSLTNSGLTSGRVTYAGTGGLLQDDADFTFNGTTVTMANDASISGLTVGKGGGSQVTNTALGSAALAGTNTGGYTTGVGLSALQSNTSGRNTAFGALAAAQTTTGTLNTSIGDSSLYNNTTGGYNVAVGQGSLQANTTASNNTAVGYQAGYTNTTGADNIFIGYQAGYQTTSSSNVLIGKFAGYWNTGVGNSFVGHVSGTGSSGATGTYNSFFGFNSGNSLTTGSYNVSVGLSAGRFTTSGGNNTAIGSEALYSNTTASNNTAVGYQALYSNTTAADNTAVGYTALDANTTGIRNTAIGSNAIGSNTTGNYNTAVGYFAGGSLTTGSDNTFVGPGRGNGDGAGYLITTGSKNTILGGYSGNQGGLDIRTASNYIVLSDGDGNPRQYFDNNGYSYINGSAAAFGFGNQRFNITTSNGSGESALYLNNQASNQATVILMAQQNTSYTSNVCDWRNGTAAGAGWNWMIFRTGSSSGGAGTTAFLVVGNGNVQNANNSYGSTSDIKLKENIVDATPKLKDLMQVKIRNYNLKSDPTNKQIGVIAQELEQVFPKMIEETPDKDEQGNDLGTVTKGVKYSVFVPMLIKAVQELKAEVDSLKAQLNK